MPTSAIASSSVLKITRVSLWDARAASAVYSSKGLPQSGRIFFRQIPFEPPRAVITPRTRIRLFSFQVLLDKQRNAAVSAGRAQDSPMPRRSAEKLGHRHKAGF